MIRIISVLAGGLLGLAAAIMASHVTDAYVPDSGSVETVLSRQPYTGMRSRWPSHQWPAAEAAQPVVAMVENSDIYRLQSQLTESGCYEGAIDGQWSPQFHERLAYVAVTSELDLEALGTVSRIVDALKETGPTVCEETRQFVSVDAVPEVPTRVERVRRATLNSDVTVERHPERVAPVVAEAAVPRPVLAEKIELREVAKIFPTSGYLEVAPTLDQPEIAPVPMVLKVAAVIDPLKVAALASDARNDELPEVTAFATAEIPSPDSNLLRGTAARRAIVPAAPTRRVRIRRRRTRAVAAVVKPKPKPVKRPWKENRRAIFPDR